MRMADETPNKPHFDEPTMRTPLVRSTFLYYIQLDGFYYMTSAVGNDCYN